MGDSLGQIWLASRYGLTIGRKIEFERTDMFHYTGRLQWTTNSPFKFTLHNVTPEDSGTTIRKRGVFDVQSISDNSITVAYFRFIGVPREFDSNDWLRTLTAEMRIIPQEEDMLIYLANEFERAPIETFGIKEEARFCFKKDNGLVVGNVPRNKQLKFTCVAIQFYTDAHDKHYEDLPDLPDTGCIRVISFDRDHVFGLLNPKIWDKGDMRNQGLYVISGRHLYGRIYVHLLYVSTSFGRGITI